MVYLEPNSQYLLLPNGELVAWLKFYDVTTSVGYSMPNPVYLWCFCHRPDECGTRSF